MKTLFRTVAGCVVAAGVLTAAQTQAPVPPKPGPEHERLGFFVGTWTAEGEMLPGPMGPGGKLSWTDRCEWFPGHFAIECRGEGQGPTGRVENIGLLGYNAEEKVYTYYGVDNSGLVMTTVARGTVQGDTWTYHDESTIGGRKIKSRVTIKEVSPTEQTFLMEIQGPEGAWIPVMKSRSTKSK